MSLCPVSSLSYEGRVMSLKRKPGNSLCESNFLGFNVKLMQKAPIDREGFVLQSLSAHRRATTLERRGVCETEALSFLCGEAKCLANA